MQLCTMTTVIHDIWQRWQQRRKQRKLNSLLVQREQIRKRGMCIYAVVEDCMQTNLQVNEMMLLRVRLKIRLLDNQCIYPLCYAFVPDSWRHLKGLAARVQFIAGDLSQVIIKI
jgi:hypothetical protein